MDRSNDTVPEGFDPFAAGEVVATFPMTESQREIWTAASLGEDASCAFNESVSLELAGPLDIHALECAIEHLVERHQSMRLTFSADGELACVNSGISPDVRVVDILDDAEFKHLVECEVTTAFDLVHGPLYRFVFARRSEAQHVLVMTAHHIVCDGWAILNAMRDLSALYEAETLGTDQPGPATQFDAYAQRLEETDQGDAEEYWLSQYEESIPILELPLDRPRSTLRTFDSDRLEFCIPAPLVERLKSYARSRNVSMFATLYSAWVVCLRRITGASDIVCGIPAAGQSASGMTDLVGHCVNLLPIRLQADDCPFREFVNTARGQILDALDNQEFTFGRLVRRVRVPRDPGRIPVVSVQFNLDPPLDLSDLSFGGLDVTFRSNARMYENFEIFLNLSEHAGEIAAECQFNSNLFERGTIDAWLTAYRTLLESICDDDSVLLSRLNLIDPATRTRLLDEWGACKADFDLDVTVVDLIEAQAVRSPDAEAIRCGSFSVSYRELSERSSQIANYLKSSGGVQEDQLVGIAMSRSVDLVVAALSIWKAGGCYVPLDPQFPRSRLEFMVDHSRLECIVTESDLVARLPVVQNMVCLDALAAEVGACSIQAPELDRARVKRAYVIYTSGSTGKPKGVEVAHRSVSNFLQSMQRSPGMDSEDVLVAVTTLSFDIAVLELYLPLIAGGLCVVATEEQAQDASALRTLIEGSGATAMQATPATWQVLLDSNWTPGGQFKALCGGEAVPLPMARELSERTAQAYNVYGPTETTVWSLLEPMERGLEKVTIGHPIHNTEIRIVDEHLNVVPPGVPGELLIGGEGVTLGYLHQPELTTERYVRLQDAEDRLFYRTGDLTRWCFDGVVEYQRRLDTQVKVRGFRIELGEIEAALQSHSAVEQAVANVYQPSDGDARIAAYYVSSADIPVQELREHIAAYLPSYMLPQHFIKLDAIPHTPNRKVDRQGLPAPIHDRRVGFLEPRTESERAIAAIWQDIIGVERVGATDDFFELGGHSILAIRVASRIKQGMGVDLPIRRLFANPSLDALAHYLDGLLAMKQTQSRGDRGEVEELSF